MPPEPREAREFVVGGRVQGVGYRPFVYRLAHDLELTGSVRNGAGRVFLHAEGPVHRLDALGAGLVDRAPPLARPVLEGARVVELTGVQTFTILPSESVGTPEIHVPPDLFTCDDCLAELRDPGERRHDYPFINCTQCGPRYTLITAMPYDRPNTSMAGFPLCEACRREYESPLDRRFHAQPLACPECGPRLRFVGHDGLPSERDALTEAVEQLAAGAVLAVKGVGGYHLVCDAANDTAVRALRERKRRPHKPLAVMFPETGADGLEALRRELAPGAAASRALRDPARPIVLVPRRPDCRLSQALAPGLRELGAFLPYSPLHHLLLGRLGRPVVATSGNLSGEPVITDDVQATERLGQVADAFLHHARPRVRPADDPVMVIQRDRARPLRLGRGTAPTELALPTRLPRPLLATGGHMKNTIALGWEERAVVSPHIGDLDAPRSRDVFEQVVADLQSLYGVAATGLVVDRHPGYAGHRWARRQDLPVIEVQHHAAHASGLAGEHPDIGNWLVFTWDGVGLGTDDSLWGGEALAGGPGHWQRVASFRPFTLTGGDRAGREPWRSAAALTWALEHDWNPVSVEAALARQAWRRDTHCHRTTAVGRLFDAAACLVLGREQASFEGQGPMELEHVADPSSKGLALPLDRDEQGLWRSDWAPLLEPLLDARRSAAERAGLFHATLARALVAQVRTIMASRPVDAVGLTGGVFQNRLLTGLVCEQLGAINVSVRLHRAVPANDGGLAYGQLVEAAAREQEP